MATTTLPLGALNGNCTVALVYDTNTLRVTAVQVLNPSTSLVVTITKPTGQVVTETVPVSPTLQTFNIPNNFMTLVRDPVDASICIPDGWSYSVVS